MRQLLTIIRYEFLMQIKSIRFKALCLLVLWMEFMFYTTGIRMQEFPPQQRFLNLEILWLYLVAFVFTGLFSIGRIRDVGMHAVLMTKPFPTFMLLLGQLVAGLLSLLLPLALLFFPAGLALRWQFGIDFPLPPLFYVLLFYMIPEACCTLALTIWVRTCFKNNIAAIVILGLIFFGMIILANSPWLNLDTDQGRIHNFVPMVSYFSEFYTRANLQRVFQQPRISFLHAADWIHLGLSALYSMVFLMLGGLSPAAHQPQRKVLGTYGSQWYHTPTFLRAACDLKCDPFLRARHHLALTAMVGVIMVKTVWPLAGPGVRAIVLNWTRPARPGAAGFAGPGAGLSIDTSRMEERQLLKVRILRDEQTITPEQVTSRLTVAVEGDTSGTLAAIYGYRWQYNVTSITLDGRPLPFSNRGFIYIDGRQFAPVTGKGTHTVAVTGRVNKDFMDASGANGTLMISG
ncbi:MAG: hypothetical protein M1457_10925, partial [bacterium]|nr:hypothetical protein [bacterium]